MIKSAKRAIQAILGDADEKGEELMAEDTAGGCKFVEFETFNGNGQ